MKGWRLLDLGSGAGGIAWGYHLAGFSDITGVDNVPQPNYPFTFIQADMLTFGIDPERYDAVHLSAPCQRWCRATLGQRKAGREYPDLITPMRPRLEESGLPWVMENVPEAPLRADAEVCGCMFGLSLDIGYLARKRVLETSWGHVQEPVIHDHAGPAISIAGHGTPAWQRRSTGHVPVARWREIMGISWMTREELTEAVPPAYGYHAGKLLLGQLKGK